MISLCRNQNDCQAAYENVFYYRFDSWKQQHIPEPDALYHRMLIDGKGTLGNVEVAIDMKHLKQQNKTDYEASNEWQEYSNPSFQIPSELKHSKTS